MNTEMKTKWVAALRSGDYRQVEGLLRSQAKNGSCSFCCLGVLADVAGADWESGLLKTGQFISDPDEEVLSDGAEQLFGLNSHEQSTLAEMNDRGDSFDVIADYIEANL